MSEPVPPQPPSAAPTSPSQRPSTPGGMERGPTSPRGPGGHPSQMAPGEGAGYGYGGYHHPHYPHPHYPSYPPPGQGGGYPPPSYGYHPPPPPHHHAPPYSGYPPYGYGGSSGGYGYPPQKSEKPPTQPPHPSAPPQSQISTSQQQQQRRKSPSRRGQPVPAAPAKDTKAVKASPQVSEDIQMERMRAAAEPVQVKPMRSDYHFFVDDMKASIKELAEQELGDDKDDEYLLFSNMNARLIKAWEQASAKTREKYMAKEEEDRRRFMTDDEIASRHCATLTARARSPRPGNVKTKGEVEEETSASGKKRTSPTNAIESPPKRGRTDDDKRSEDEEEDDDDEPEEDETRTK